MKKQIKSRMHIFTVSKKLIIEKILEVLKRVFENEKITFDLNNPFGGESWEIWSDGCTDAQRLYASGVARGIYELLNS